MQALHGPKFPEFQVDSGIAAQRRSIGATLLLIGVTSGHATEIRWYGQAEQCSEVVFSVGLIRCK